MTLLRILYVEAATYSVGLLFHHMSFPICQLNSVRHPEVSPRYLLYPQLCHSRSGLLSPPFSTAVIVVWGNLALHNVCLTNPNPPRSTPHPKQSTRHTRAHTEGRKTHCDPGPMARTSGALPPTTLGRGPSCKQFCIMYAQTPGRRA